MDIIADLKSRARHEPRKIVFPEGDNSLILEVAQYLAKNQYANPVVLGAPQDRIDELNQYGVQTVDIASDPLLDSYVEDYCRSREMPEAVGRYMVSQALCFACMMVKTGRADALVAGINVPTEEVILACQMILGLQEGISVPSSFSLLKIPGYRGSYGHFLIFADPSIQPDPSSIELADIACMTANTVKKLLHWEPKVALLSFSTKGSAVHPRVQKVVDAVVELKKRNCDFAFDGELQLDAAINQMVAKKKIRENNAAVAGQANVLIFPDLNAGNIGLKLVEQFANAKMYGPILQGFKFPVSDLSRGAVFEDIVGSALIISALCT